MLTKILVLTMIINCMAPISVYAYNDRTIVDVTKSETVEIEDNIDDECEIMAEESDVLAAVSLDEATSYDGINTIDSEAALVENTEDAYELSKVMEAGAVAKVTYSGTTKEFDDFALAISEANKHSGSTITLLNDVNFADDIDLRSGNINLAKHSLTVSGDMLMHSNDANDYTLNLNAGELDVKGKTLIDSHVILEVNKGCFTTDDFETYGHIVMKYPEDKVVINGDWYNGAYRNGGVGTVNLLEAGEMTIRGNLTNVTGRTGGMANEICATGTHTLILDGNKRQTINLSGHSCFNNVKMGPDSDGTVNIKGTFGFVKMLSDIELFTDESSFNMKNIGAGGNEVTINGNVNLAKANIHDYSPNMMLTLDGGKLNIDGDFTINNEDSPYKAVVGDLNGGTLKVNGDLNLKKYAVKINKGKIDAKNIIISKAAGFDMVYPEDRINVKGDFTICDSGTVNDAYEYKDGCIYIGGNFYQKEGYSFKFSDKHKVIMNGTENSTQVISFAAEKGKLNELYVPNIAGRKLKFEPSSREEKSFYAKRFNRYPEGKDEPDDPAANSTFGIEYELYGGVQNEGNPDYYKKGQKVSFKVPTKVGYSFKGWYKTEDGAKKFDPSEKITGLIGTENKDIVVYAGWDPIVYTVKYNANGGKGSMLAMNVKYDEAILLTKNAFVKDGYSFTGWNTNKLGKGVAYSDEESIQNLLDKKGTVTLYAQWSANNIEIHYVNIEETDININPSVRRMGEGIKLNDPFRVGYTFGGWYGNASFAGKKISIIAPKTSSAVTVYAKWVENNYTVTFDMNLPKSETISDNIIIPDSIVVKGKTTVSAPSLGEDIKTESGLYSFDGWCVNKKGKGTKYLPGDVINNLTSKSSVVLYAQWKAKGCEIKYELVSGNAVNKNPSWGTVLANVKLKAASDKGYTFGGWYKDLALTQKVTSITKAEIEEASQKGEYITVYAKWTPIVYTVKYNSNKGQGIINPVNLSYDEEYIIESGEKFSRNGYEFIGWSRNKKATEAEFVSGNKIKKLLNKKGNVTLFAVWSPIEYEINYAHMVDGEAVVSMNGLINSNPSKRTVAKAVKLANAKAKGFKFVGWFTDSECKNQIKSINKNECKDLTLYACWKANTYKIEYSPNGGTGDVQTSGDNKCGKAVSIKSCKYTKAGYTFVGWSDSMRGSKADMESVNPKYSYYQPGESVENGFVTFFNNGTVHLYAVWAEE